MSTSIRPLHRILAVLLAALAVMGGLAALADLGLREVLGRPLDPASDWRLALPALDVLRGSLGPGAAFAAAAVALGLPAAALMGLARGLARRRLWAGGVAVLLVATGAASVAARDGGRAPAAAPAPAAPLPGLAGVDVIIVFIESYGRSALDATDHGPRIRPRLAEISGQLDRAGLATASGWVRSPVLGGGSFLAHATLLSGTEVDRPERFAALLRTPGRTLAGDLAASGHRTVAVMPAITKPWPEGAALGFRQRLTAPELAYRGPPFDWVTMPDQFTLDAFERRARRDPSGTSIFATIALVSSHLPWTPIPPVLDDWDAIGDGAVYRGTERAARTPDEIWRDVADIRAHYALSLDYALDVVGRYLVRATDRHTLAIVLGDHQPIPLVSGGDGVQDVPIHVVSGDPALVAALAATAGLAPGFVPPATAPVGEMAALRGALARAFGAGAADPQVVTGRGVPAPPS